MTTALTATLTATLLLASQSVPAAAAPGLPNLPATWGDAPAAAADWVSTGQASHWTQGQWWRLFDDAVLDALVAQLASSNQSLKAAAANVAQAQALLRAQQANHWPTLGLQASQQRSGGDDKAATSSAALGLAASWAPGLWGRVQGAVDAQSASVQASQADLAGARLAAQASLVNAYLWLRQTDAEIALLDDIIDSYQRSQRITQNRYEAGVVARTDILQAQNTLTGAQSSRVALQRTRDTCAHAIAVLLGQPPAVFTLPQAGWTATVPAVPAGVPALLLLRRPDVASAERAVAAANAQIGVARSAYFPSLTLSASLGSGAGTLGQLLSAPSLVWSLGVALAQTVLDGGARAARIDQTSAAYDAAVASYHQTALAALGQVQDQLTALAALQRQQALTQASADNATRIEQQMFNRYQAGLSAYTEVVTAQASALAARRSLLQLQLQRQQATVALIQALGGGWQAPWSAAADAAPQTEAAPISGP